MKQPLGPTSVSVNYYLIHIAEYARHLDHHRENVEDQNGPVFEALLLPQVEFHVD